MNKGTKRIVTLLVVIGIIAGACYGGYRLYNFIVANAITDITKGVTKKVGGAAFNPFRLLKK